MAKLDALKEKLSAFRTQFSEKVDKITFLKKWKEKKAATAGQAPSPYSLGRIYQEGGLGTRLQVILVYVFALAALVATFQAGRKMLKRMASSAEHEKLKEDYAHGLAEMSQKVVDNASLIALGKFRANANADGQGGRFVALDIWVRVSDPGTADFMQKNEALFHDRVADTLNVVYLEGIELLTDQGKNAAKSRIMEQLNQALPKGKVEDIFFENLILQ